MLPFTPGLCLRPLLNGIISLSQVFFQPIGKYIARPFLLCNAFHRFVMAFKRMLSMPPDLFARPPAAEPDLRTPDLKSGDQRLSQPGDTLHPLQTSHAPPLLFKDIPNVPTYRHNRSMEDITILEYIGPGVNDPKVQHTAKNIRAIHPGKIARYDRTTLKLNSQINPLMLPPVTFELKGHEPREGWVPHIHPEGQLYFYKDLHTGLNRRYVTDANVYDNDVLKELNHFLCVMENRISQNTRLLPAAFEIVLELEPADDDNSWGYYMVHLQERCIFWLDELDVHKVVNEEQCNARDLCHLKIWMECAYWRHCDLYPAREVLPQRVIQELMITLLHGGIDLMTYVESTVLWTAQEVQELVNFVKGIYDLDIEKLEFEDSAIVPYVNTAIGRLLWFIASSRFLKLYGQPGARLSFFKSKYGKPRVRRSILIKFLSPLLFGSPETHLKQLEGVYVEGLVIMKHWEEHYKSIKNEWSQVIINASVLLNANVAFLAIPFLFPGVSNAAKLSVYGRLASLSSMIASLGCMTMGPLLLRQYPSNTHYSSEISAYLHKRTSKKYGLEPLSIMLSTPFAFLMLGVITFFVAVAFLCFEAVETLKQGIYITVFGAIILVVLAWVVLRHLEKPKHNRARVSIEPELRSWEGLEVSQLQNLLFRKPCAGDNPDPDSDDVKVEV